MRILTYIAFAILLAGAGSCSSFLDPGAPKNQMPAALAFTDDKTATASVTGVLSRMNQLNYQFANVLSMILPAMAADEFVYAVSSAPFDEFKDNAVSSANQYVSTLWSQPYSYIAQANACIEGLEAATGLSPAVKSQLLGEARFIRAFCYFYLVNYFGDVPLVQTTDISVSNTLGRAPAAEVYTAIIADLQDAKERLGNGYPAGAAVDAGGERIRANKAVASALLARAYLYTEQWQAAAAEATAVIGNSLYRLMDTEALDDVFKANSDETIWQLQAVNTAGGRNTWEGFLLIPATPTSSPLFRLVPGYLYDAFEAGDERFASWVGSVTTSTGAEHRYPYKYKARFGVTPVQEYTMVLRLAEQYLIRAEAALMQGRPEEAMVDINTIRRRAGLAELPADAGAYGGAGAFAAAAREALEQERRVELFGEWGHRWFDLRRWPSVTGDTNKTRADDVLPALKNDWQSADIYLPLPDAATRTNPNLLK
ncbi:RagB/SusD family nutrient uptake outer membrane protein [Parapedobacter deserti]|uniref:RagB/SusD family nutrient uptake outer membrane protein n=1 Tax=Parapedobacter deserti TaxID=1912957 RepID=A0ABV7JGC1_9SPHI